MNSFATQPSSPSPCLVKRIFCARHLCSRLAHSVFLYRSSPEFGVFVLTRVGINTPVTREPPTSDRLTGSTKQAALGGFGTQRSRPSAGGGASAGCYFGKESEWLAAEQKHHDYLEGDRRPGRNNSGCFLRGLGGSRRRLKGNSAKLFNAIKQKRSFQVV